MATDPNALNSWETTQRADRHARDPELERLLALLNDHLHRARELTPRPVAPALPVVFVVGCARAGSTLLMQWLAHTGMVAYATNIISRFYKDPYVGALVHRILHDLDHRGEVFPDKPDRSAFRSELGRTHGADAPHDFGYFWRNYFGFGELQCDLVRTPDATQSAALQSDVAGMEQVFGRPVMLKAMEMNWHLPAIRALFPDSVFLFVQRDPIANAASLLKARRSFYGDDGAWYSYKPAEYDTIKTLPPWEQVVAQVWHTNKAVRNGLKGLPAADVIEVEYERFCADPAWLHRLIATRLGTDASYTGPLHFAASSAAVTDEMKARAQHMLERLR